MWESCEKKGIIFIWKIENYSFGWHTETKFCSPWFDIGLSSQSKYQLCLENESNKINIYCIRSESERYELIYDISLLNSRGLPELRKTLAMPSSYRTGRNLDIIPDEVFDLRKHDFLPQDTLTILCHVKEASSSLEYSRYFARTRIGVEQSSFLWNMKNFSSFKSGEEKTVVVESSNSQFLPLTFKLFLTGESKMDEKLDVEIHRSGKDKKGLCILKLSLLNNVKESIVIAKDRHVFQNTEAVEVWRFPQIIKKSELIGAKKQLLPDDELCLKCELAYSLGILYNHMEFTWRGIDCCQNVDSLLSDSDKLSSAVFEDHNDSLKRAMKCLLEEGSFYDVHLRVGDVNFPVHKAVLSARSPVFKAMFSRDMVEKSCDMVDIKDLDDDTVRQMLLYLYTDAIDDLQWENVEKLYFAADKYEIMCLKKKCSSIFMSKMQPSNVCQLLLMADLHQDEVLKSAIHDFIYENDIQILNLDEWKTLEQNNPRLTSEAMRYVCLKKR